MIDEIPTLPMFKCPECDLEKEMGRWEFREGDCGPYCEDCGSEVQYTREQPVEFVCVALYRLDRSYGGPEEGGWYYTVGNLVERTVRCFDAGDWPQARLYRDRLWGEAEANRKEGWGLFGVRVYADQLAPANFPSVKPHYC